MKAAMRRLQAGMIIGLMRSCMVFLMQAASAGTCLHAHMRTRNRVDEECKNVAHAFQTSRFSPLALACTHERMCSCEWTMWIGCNQACTHMHMCASVHASMHMRTHAAHFYDAVTSYLEHQMWIVQAFTQACSCARTLHTLLRCCHALPRAPNVGWEAPKVPCVEGLLDRPPKVKVGGPVKINRVVLSQAQSVREKVYTRVVWHLQPQ